MKTVKVNEVQALSDVFYAFFLTKSKTVGDSNEVMMMTDMEKSTNTFFVRDYSDAKYRYVNDK